MFALRNLTPLANYSKILIKRNLHQTKCVVGNKLTVTRVFTQDDVKVFAEMVGDVNPIHLDKEYASKTKFKKTIVHGILANGYVSEYF